MNDIVAPDELATITGVPTRAHDRINKTIRVLNRAGIYFWLRHDGEIVTTWTHVHRAGVDKPSPRADKLPNFSRAS